MNLDTTLDQIYGIGSNIYKRLQKLGLNKVFDAIFYYPFRYEDFSQLKEINELIADETATIKGKIILINNKRSPRKRLNITEALIEDNSSQIQIIWFNQPYIKDNLKIGDEIYVSGSVKKSLLGFSFVNPNYETTKKETSNTARIVPIYASTENLTQKQLRYIIKQALNSINFIKEELPEAIIKNENLIDIKTALRQIHFPDSQEKLEQAKKRLSFDEIFNLICFSKIIKNENQKNKAPEIIFKEKEIQKFVKNLPFTLTKDQKIASWEIFQSLEKNIPMNRLLEGDVGSGKTIVALMASYNTILNKYQSVFMAPTQILAKQHFDNSIKYFENQNISIALFTNKDKRIFNGKKELAEIISKNDLIKKIKSGKINLIIGTHSVIQKDVEFSKLGLAIVDEQHRFGVDQRHEIIKKIKSHSPHFLSMTATPIPRSLALTIYGDLDISRILEKPANRKQIITKIVENKNRSKAYEFIFKQIESGKQVFVICPLINPSDKLGVKSVESEYEKLKNDIFPNLKIAYLHGKMKEKEREETLNNFSKNETNILVSTSIIEVGIDFPNATIMMIESAERFGLASLHQFRGRVGRDTHQSFCFLFTENSNEKTKKRLEILSTTDDGFKLAEFDLKMRGSGDLYGTIQSGIFSQIKIADLSNFELIKKVQYWTNKIFLEDPELKNHKGLKEKMNLLMKDIHLE